jgi:hypothetical protein
MLRRLLLWVLLPIYLLGIWFVWTGTLIGFAVAGPNGWSTAKRWVFATEKAVLWPVIPVVYMLGIKDIPLLPHHFMPDRDTTPPGPPKPIRPVPNPPPAN